MYIYSYISKYLYRVKGKPRSPNRSVYINICLYVSMLFIYSDTYIYVCMYIYSYISTYLYRVKGKPDGRGRSRSRSPSRSVFILVCINLGHGSLLR